MSDKHTPRPWKITEDDYGHEHWLGGDGEGQICVNGWVNGGCKKYPSKWRKLQADARLIAAAPDLLEALKAIVGIDAHSILTEAEADAIHQQARAAIAKAEAK